MVPYYEERQGQASSSSRAAKEEAASIVDIPDICRIGDCSLLLHGYIWSMSHHTPVLETV